MFNKSKTLYIKDNNLNYVSKVIVVKQKGKKAITLLYTCKGFTDL